MEKMLQRFSCIPIWFKFPCFKLLCHNEWNEIKTKGNDKNYERIKKGRWLFPHKRSIINAELGSKAAPVLWVQFSSVNKWYNAVMNSFQKIQQLPLKVLANIQKKQPYKVVNSLHIQHFNVGSTLFLQCRLTLKKRDPTLKLKQNYNLAQLWYSVSVRL